MRAINKIVIHCSATYPEMNIDVEDIRRWHKNKGWSDIGYHFVITRDGYIQEGRPVEKTGAHAKGHNTGSIGVCLVGGIDKQGHAQSNFTNKQWASLLHKVDQLRKDHNIEFNNIIGHNEVSSKACPSFNVRQWVESNF